MRTLSGRYDLDRRLGIGGMSEVWRAHDRVLDRPVAVKLIGPRQADDETLEQLHREARSAARLVHPNVASVHDFGLASRPAGVQVPYIVMELVEGETLAAHLRAGPLDWQIAVRVCAEVAAALAAAHAHGIVHRDIKPSNVMLTPSGAKVLDFGIATSLDSEEPDLDGTVVGTSAFVAPERWDGEPATPASDIYAVGVLLYVCLAGRLPWPVDPAGGPPGRHLVPDPLPPIDGLPDDVVELCERSLARDPAQRPTSHAVALLWGDAVDARVYVPLAEALLERPRPPEISAWDDRAANAATDIASPSDA